MGVVIARATAPNERGTKVVAAENVDSSELLLNTEGMTTTATFSELLRKPNDVVAQLEKGDVLLTRREGRPLRLSLAEPAEAENAAIGAITRFIMAAADDALYARIADGLIDDFPWMEFLPKPARSEFVAEFLRTARACIAVSRFDRLAVLLAAWRGTAEAYADPRITIDGSDLDYLAQPQVVADPRSE